MENNKKPAVRVKVIVVTGNNTAWIDQQLHAILAQASVMVDVVIVDQGMNELARDHVALQFGTQQGVTVLSQSRDGGAAGGHFNDVVRSIGPGGFDYLAFVDPQDMWHAETLAQAIACMENAAADGYSTISPNGAAGRPDKSFYQPVRAADHLFEGAGQGCSVVLRANFFREIQQFCTDQKEIVDRLHQHDWLVYILARAWGRRWFFDAAAATPERQHGRHPTGAAVNWRASIRQRIAVIRSGGYQHQLLAACAIYTKSGGADASAVHLSGIFLAPRQKKPTLYQRMTLAVLLMKHGRRQAPDRMVSGMAALLGWI